MIGYDSAAPLQQATSEVFITVIRNQNPPIFRNEPYQVTISDTQAIGSSIIRITAEDADNVRFFINPSRNFDKLKF